MIENIPYLLLSVSLSAGRNVISKKTAVTYSGWGQFFFSQTLLFGCAAVLMLIFGITDLIKASPITWVFGGIYGVLLLLSQWMFTLGLKNGVASVCTVVYSLGFIIPTLVGTYFWGEKLTVFGILGILIAAVIILLSAKKEKREPIMLPRFSCHIFRHTFASRFCENETNIKVIQAVMGHADISTTMNIYAMANPEVTRPALENLAKNMDIF